MTAMEAGVKYSDLGNVGHSLEDRFDWREVVRLVQGGQRGQFSQLGQDLAGDDDGLR